MVKWPIALSALVALPFAVEALGASPLTQLSGAHWTWLGYGAAAYALGWILLFRHAFSGSYLSTFEHELTHALFAWVTLHRVTGLTVTWRDGGVCTYEGSGGGNWLISIAPYWFPTLVWPPLIAAQFVEARYLDTVHFLIGFTIVYHLTSTWRETHRAQPDLQKTSFTFAWMFLPTANLLVYGGLLLAATSGWDDALALLGDVWLGVGAFVGGLL